MQTNKTFILGMLLIFSFTLTANELSEFNQCSDMTIMDYPMMEHCAGFRMALSKNCQIFIINFVRIELPKLAHQKVLIPRREQNNLACTPDSEVDDVSDIVTISLKDKLIDSNKWLDLVSHSHNEILNYSVYSTLILNGYDSALPLILEFAQGDDGDIPEDLKQTLALSATNLAVNTLITNINQHGYPQYRAGVNQLSNNQNPIWSKFLCDYYPQVRSPLRLFFGKGAAQDFSIKQRFEELNKVMMDSKLINTCSFWL